MAVMAVVKTKGGSKVGGVWMGGKVYIDADQLVTALVNANDPMRAAEVEEVASSLKEIFA